MLRNPIGMPDDDWQIFYKNVKTIPFDQMAAKDSENIKQARKKLELKYIKYE